MFKDLKLKESIVDMFVFDEFFVIGGVYGWLEICILYRYDIIFFLSVIVFWKLFFVNIFWVWSVFIVDILRFKVDLGYLLISFECGKWWI